MISRASSIKIATKVGVAAAWVTLATVYVKVLAYSVHQVSDETIASIVSLGGATGVVLGMLSVQYADYLFRRYGIPLTSTVPGHEGKAYIVWLNRNQFCIRQDGLTGFFKNMTGGEEFHGEIRGDTIYTTKS